MFLFRSPTLTLPSRDEALPGRSAAIAVPDEHFVTRRALLPPWPDGHEVVDVAMGCFWGAEQRFWEIDGVWVTAVGYQGGYTPNPTYREVCTGRTGHTESVRVVFDPTRVAFAELLSVFWESHNPTQGMRQGNDVGTQYRSAIFVHSDEQRAAAEASLAAYSERLAEAGYGPITTTIESAPEFYYAEPEHQQYLAKNPNGYCGIGGTGVSCPVGVVRAADPAGAASA
jgi:peptide-methionine (S)-S-oxide reductase